MAAGSQGSEWAKFYKNDGEWLLLFGVRQSPSALAPLALLHGYRIRAPLEPIGMANSPVVSRCPLECAKPRSDSGRRPTEVFLPSSSPNQPTLKPRLQCRPG